MSHNPGPGVIIPAHVWSRTVKIPASILNGLITTPSKAIQNANLTGNISVGQGLIHHSKDIGGSWPVSEADVLKEQVEKLTARVVKLEDLTNKQHVAINELISVVDQLMQNSSQAQNNSGHRGYQVAEYWQET